MRIKVELAHTDIEQALREYVARQGFEVAARGGVSIEVHEGDPGDPRSAGRVITASVEAAKREASQR